jgi:hypothetical protein
MEMAQASPYNSPVIWRARVLPQAGALREKHPASGDPKRVASNGEYE